MMTAIVDCKQLNSSFVAVAVTNSGRFDAVRARMVSLANVFGCLEFTVSFRAQLIEVFGVAFEEN